MGFALSIVLLMISVFIVPYISVYMEHPVGTDYECPLFLNSLLKGWLGCKWNCWSTSSVFGHCYFEIFPL